MKIQKKAIVLSLALLISLCNITVFATEKASANIAVTENIRTKSINLLEESYWDREIQVGARS